MIPDDDSVLSAYLDGQLGPEEQQAVEAALLDDPRLAEELRGLVVLRDLLAGLPREYPGDLTSRVMRRIRRRALLGTARGIIALGPARAAGLVAIAAGVMAVLALPWVHPVRRPDDARGPDVVTAAPPQSVERPRPPIAADRWPDFASPRVDRPAEQEGAHPSPAPSAGGTPPARDELVHVREYLDHPRLRHVFLVSDPGDGSDERRVASVVEQTTRFNYYKITVSRGIMLDPRHPDEAMVFALVVAPDELDHLRDRLRVALNDRVEEESAEPAVVTRLADVGTVESCRPLQAAEMEIPREAVAFKDGGAAAGVAVEQPVAPPAAAHPDRADKPTREQEYSTPAAEILAQQERDRRTLVVLVWVTRARPG